MGRGNAYEELIELSEAQKARRTRHLCILQAREPGARESDGNAFVLTVACTGHDVPFLFL